MQIDKSDLIRLLIKEPNKGGPFDAKVTKRNNDITENVKKTLETFCKRKGIPLPQIHALRFGKTELGEYTEEAADSIWQPYVISMIARQQCSNIAATYFAMLKDKPSSETLKGLYEEKPFTLRGIRLNINSKIIDLTTVLEMATYLEAETREPVALAFNNEKYDWEWSLGITNAH